jgi:hypothetical protein
VSGITRSIGTILEDTDFSPKPLLETLRDRTPEEIEADGPILSELESLLSTGHVTEVTD